MPHLSPTPITVDLSPFYTALFKGIIQGIPPFLASTWYMWLIILAIGGLKLFVEMYHYYKLSKAGMFEIDKMSGPDFELFLDSLFSKLGYRTEHTGKTGDFGSDLVIEKDGTRIAVQAKRYQNHVGEDAVREAFSVKNLRQCTGAMVVTNSYFTPKAKILAQSDQVILWNRDDLAKSILQSQKSP